MYKKFFQGRTACIILFFLAKEIQEGNRAIDVFISLCGQVKSYFKNNLGQQKALLNCSWSIGPKQIYIHEVIFGVSFPPMFSLKWLLPIQMQRIKKFQTCRVSKTISWTLTCQRVSLEISMLHDYSKRIFKNAWLVLTHYNLKTVPLPQFQQLHSPS